MVAVKRFDICLVALDPTLGSEIKKTRPCVIISPDAMNQSRLKTVIIAPMTSVIREHFPTRVSIEFKGKTGQVALEQLRAIDRERIVKSVGTVPSQKTKKEILTILHELFT